MLDEMTRTFVEEKIKLHEMKNEKTTWVFFMIKIWQILKDFARSFHQA